MLQDISTFALFTAPVIGVAVPVYILVVSTLNFRHIKKGRVYVILKALVALVGWFLASWGMFFMLFITFYVNAHARVEDREIAEKGGNMGLIILSLIYALIGCGLALWVRHKADNEPVRIFPDGAT